MAARIGRGFPQSTRIEGIPKHDTIAGAAALSATGTVTATATLVISGTLAISGSGTFSATGDVIDVGVAMLSGGGTFTATGTISVAGSAALAATSTFSATLSRIVSGAASLTATSSFSATPTFGSIDPVVVPLINGTSYNNPYITVTGASPGSVRVEIVSLAGFASFGDATNVEFSLYELGGALISTGAASRAGAQFTFALPVLEPGRYLGRFHVTFSGVVTQNYPAERYIELTAA